jgi:hypothetical protein
MSLRLTAIVVGLLVVLAGVVWYTEFRDKGSEAGAATPDKQDLEVISFQEPELRQLEVSRGDQRTTAQRDDQDNWTLQPSGQPADRVRMSSVVSRLMSLRATRRVADTADDLAQYGLTTPSLVATATLADGTAHVLQVGDRAPAGNGHYAKRAADTAVFLIASQLVTDLERLVTEPPIQLPTPTPAAIPSPSPPVIPTSTPAPTPTPGS